MENTENCYLMKHRCFGHCEKHCYTENGYLILDHEFLCEEQYGEDES